MGGLELRSLLLWLAWVVFLSLVAFFTRDAWAQAPFGFESPAGVVVQDEGATQGRARTMNFTGTGVSATVTAGTATVTISGGAGYNQLQEEGTNLTQRAILNFIGSSITCVDDGASKTNCTVTGGAGATWTEHEIDLDTCGVGVGKGSRVCKKTVTDAGVSSTSKIAVLHSAKAATGRQADENELDPITCRAEPSAGSFTLICKGHEGPIHGKYLVNYTVG